MKWQNIKTAPKDGTLIWVTHIFSYPEMWVAKWHKDETVPGFYAHKDEFLLRPTHWMPLPEPPVSK